MDTSKIIYLVLIPLVYKAAQCFIRWHFYGNANIKDKKTIVSLLWYYGIEIIFCISYYVLSDENVLSKTLVVRPTTFDDFVVYSVIFIMVHLDIMWIICSGVSTELSNKHCIALALYFIILEVTLLANISTRMNEVNFNKMQYNIVLTQTRNLEAFSNTESSNTKEANM